MSLLSVCLEDKSRNAILLLVLGLALRTSCVMVLHGIWGLLDPSWTQVFGVNP